MPKVAAEKPNPANAPLMTASARTGAGPKNQPKVAAAMRPQTAAPPKTRPGCAGFMSSVMPAAAFQALPKTGPYQGPPITNTKSVESPTAIQFIDVFPYGRDGKSAWFRPRARGERGLSRARSQVFQ